MAKRKVNTANYDTLTLSLERAMALAVAVSNSGYSPDHPSISFGKGEIDVTSVLGDILNDEIYRARGVRWAG